MHDKIHYILPLNDGITTLFSIKLSLAQTVYALIIKLTLSSNITTWFTLFGFTK